MTKVHDRIIVVKWSGKLIFKVIFGEGISAENKKWRRSGELLAQILTPDAGGSLLDGEPLEGDPKALFSQRRSDRSLQHFAEPAVLFRVERIVEAYEFG